jgi:hypothetical protein
MAKFGNGAFINDVATLGHELKEQTAKQLSGVSDKPTHHQLGLSAEAAISGSIRGLERADSKFDPNTATGKIYLPYTKGRKQKDVELHLNRGNVTKVKQ